MNVQSQNEKLPYPHNKYKTVKSEGRPCIIPSCSPGFTPASTSEQYLIQSVSSLCKRNLSGGAALNGQKSDYLLQYFLRFLDNN